MCERFERERNVLSCTWIVILNVTVPSSLSLFRLWGNRDYDFEEDVWWWNYDVLNDNIRHDLFCDV